LFKDKGNDHHYHNSYKRADYMPPQLFEMFKERHLSFSAFTFFPFKSHQLIKVSSSLFSACKDDKSYFVKQYRDFIVLYRLKTILLIIYLFWDFDKKFLNLDMKLKIKYFLAHKGCSDGENG
jgi:hypothetical protein